MSNAIKTFSGRDIQRTSTGVEIIKGALPANDNGGRPRPAASRVEVKIEGAWWAGTVASVGAVTRIRMDVGAPVTDAVVTKASFGAEWRLSALAVHHVPLTGQGVRNLNLAAPPARRNGRHVKLHRMYRAICEHPEETLKRDEEFALGPFDDDAPIFTVEEPIFADWDLRRKFPYEPEPEFEEPVAFEIWAPCTLCGAEKFLGERVNRARKVRADHGGQGDQYERAAFRTS